MSAMLEGARLHRSPGLRGGGGYSADALVRSLPRTCNLQLEGISPSIRARL